MKTRRNTVSWLLWILSSMLIVVSQGEVRPLTVNDP